MSPELGPYAFLPDQLEFMISQDDVLMTESAKVSADAYYRERGISAGSLHKLLVHAMAAQVVWLTRMESGGTANPKLPTDVEIPTREMLLDRWPQVHANLRAFVAKQTAESLARPLNFHNTRGDAFSVPLGQILLHVIDHGTYHRGQENTMLKMAGGSPKNPSFYLWRIANPL
jgi:uncharacterized damage-inducible protein DinB